MNYTKKGFLLERAENVFTLKELKVMYDIEAKSCYSQETFSSQLVVFAGNNKDTCGRMVTSWLLHLEDEELLNQAEDEVHELFSQELALDEPLSDDEQVN